jgi:hypothetical protein
MSFLLEIPHYGQESFLSAPLGNNAFDYPERSSLHPEPYLRLAPLLQYGSAAEALASLAWSTVPAFEIIENGSLKSFAGLENFLLFPNPAPATRQSVPAPCPVFIFDNHNHAFYFWHVCLHPALQKTAQPKKVAPFTLVHIDQHKDTRIPATLPELPTAADAAAALYAYTNEILNVGNFIPPALKTGLIGKVINVDSSASLQTALNAIAPPKLILDLDLDFFAPELDYIPQTAKIALFKKLLPAASVVTIATSPYFLDQQKVPALLRTLFN